MSKLELNTLISKAWKKLGSNELTYWVNQADIKKKEHYEKHPNYVYRPHPRGRARSTAARRLRTARVQQSPQSLSNTSDLVAPRQSIPVASRSKKSRNDARSRRGSLLGGHHRRSESTLPTTCTVGPQCQITQDESHLPTLWNRDSGLQVNLSIIRFIHAANIDTVSTIHRKFCRLESATWLSTSGRRR
jgi:hypothetical protein